MAHDSDISFGDVEEVRPGRARRPDKHGHYAVVAYGEIDDRDLPIFVDLDVLVDMESHALTDTSVELGGVMLGGQHEDEDGKPFVLVTDSVRAEHYEATKGSFKFTHETWQQISRRRDEFPSEVAMVGWYHTHPDWGVFLSGMDTFICDHFFNRPLDVALVIDPCRQDRGWFQWTGDPRDRQRRTAGFYVVTSRLRHEELEFYVAQLEGQMPTRTVPGYSMSTGGNSPAPIINIHEEKAGWMGNAVLGILGMQFLFMLFLGAAFVASKLPNEEETAAKKEVDELKKQVEALKRGVIDYEQIRAREKLLDDVVAKLDPTASGTVTRMSDAEAEARRLRTSIDAGNMGFETLKKEHEKKINELNQTAANLVTAKENYETAKGDLKKATDRLAAIDKEKKKAAEGTEETGNFWTSPTGIAIAISSVVILIGFGAAASLGRGPPGRRDPPGESDPPRELTIESEEPPTPPGPRA